MTEENKFDLRHGIKGYAFSMIAWIITALILITASSIIAFSGDDPDAKLNVLSLAALYLSALISGIFSARLSGKFTTVIFTALTVTGIVLLASAFKPAGQNSYGAVVTSLCYVLVAAAVLLGGLAVLLIMKKSSSKPRRKKARRR